MPNSASSLSPNVLPFRDDIFLNRPFFLSQHWIKNLPDDLYLYILGYLVRFMKELDKLYCNDHLLV